MQLKISISSCAAAINNTWKTGCPLRRLEMEMFEAVKKRQPLPGSESIDID